MVVVDTLILAKYGIFQPIDRDGPGAMTILHPLETMPLDEKRDLMEFAQDIVAMYEESGDDIRAEDEDSFVGDEDELLHDEA